MKTDVYTKRPMLMQGSTTMAESSLSKKPPPTPKKKPELTNKISLCANDSSIWLQASKNPEINRKLPNPKFRMKLNRKNVNNSDQIVESLRSMVTQKALKMLMSPIPIVKKYLSDTASYFCISLFKLYDDSDPPPLFSFLSSSTTYSSDLLIQNLSIKTAKLTARSENKNAMGNSSSSSQT